MTKHQGFNPNFHDLVVDMSGTVQFISLWVDYKIFVTRISLERAEETEIMQIQPAKLRSVWCSRAEGQWINVIHMSEFCNVNPII